MSQVVCFKAQSFLNNIFIEPVQCIRPSEGDAEILATEAGILLLIVWFIFY